jgi:uncharacterized protein (TIGR02145 family)
MFTALGGGFRETDGIFKSMFITSGHWTTTKNNDVSANYMGLRYDTRDAAIILANPKTGLTVRCIKDN